MAEKSRAAAQRAPRAGEELQTIKYKEVFKWD